MSRRLRSYWIEAVVAAGVFGLLLVVMIPRYQRAQMAGQAVQSMLNLERIIGAMQAYNLGADKGERIDYYFTLAQSSGPAPGFAQIARIDLRTLMAAQADIAAATFQPYIQDFPVPIEAIELPSMQKRAGRYFAVSRAWQRTGSRPANALFGDDLPWPPWPHFPVSPPRRYFAMSYGPFLDNRLDRFAGRAQAAPRLTAPGRPIRHSRSPFYVRYDPSNGIRSHGFVIYYSPPQRRSGGAMGAVPER